MDKPRLSSDCEDCGASLGTNHKASCKHSLETYIKNLKSENQKLKEALRELSDALDTTHEFHGIDVNAAHMSARKVLNDT